LITQVRGINAEPVAVDPYVPEAADLTRLCGVDALILMTPHREFKDLDALLALVDNPDCIVVDAWNFWPATKSASPDGIYRAGNVMAPAAAR
jgi:UDP-N-acetyl-D-mannosaminuronic acid dehydrogenase